MIRLSYEKNIQHHNHWKLKEKKKKLNGLNITILFLLSSEKVKNFLYYLPNQQQQKESLRQALLKLTVWNQ